MTIPKKQSSVKSTKSESLSSKKSSFPKSAKSTKYSDQYYGVMLPLSKTNSPMIGYEEIQPLKRKLNVTIAPPKMKNVNLMSQITKNQSDSATSKSQYQVNLCFKSPRFDDTFLKFTLVNWTWVKNRSDFWLKHILRFQLNSFESALDLLMCVKFENLLSIFRRFCWNLHCSPILKWSILST